MLLLDVSVVLAHFPEHGLEAVLDVVPRSHVLVLFLHEHDVSVRVLGNLLLDQIERER